MQKKRFVSDLQEGELLDEFFMIKSARLGETRAGKPYLAITFFDKSGEISGPVWDHAESFCVRRADPPGTSGYRYLGSGGIGVVGYTHHREYA